jgi:hypothetical protein
MSAQKPEGLHALVNELGRRLALGESFDNQRLRELSNQFLGGTRAQGVWTPRDAYDALETAVNKFLLDTIATELMQSDADTLPTLTNLVARLPTQCDRTHEQNEFQQFSTPPTLAFMAAKLLHAKSGDTVLEPSAGTGSLAIWPRALGARVVCNEIHPRRRELLRSILGFETLAVDAEIVDDVLPQGILPDAVLMNPPFTATGGRVIQHRGKYGLLHIESALRRLREGGRLVAITSGALAFGRAAASGWWQKMAGRYHVRANFGVSGGEYRKYGTTWDVQLVVIDKAGPTPGGNWKAQLSEIVWGRAETINGAWAALRNIARAPNPDARSAHVQAPKQGSVTLFVPYVPARLTGGKQHPSVIVEAASMASAAPPNITYRPRLPMEIVTEGKLSRLQMERVIYAGQRHEQRLADGARAGYYVGDGTGVGKGRVLAAIIADNWYQQRRRALWLSVNNDLLDSAYRDLNDLGVAIPLARISDYPPAGEITLPRGVIFCSYATLISETKKSQKRLDQIQRWLGSEPVVIFDEAHRAKNALASGRGEPTQTGQAVIDLQDPRRNPDYRVVYSSATGATDVRNMAYMTRLGLWGPGTSFPEGFQQFLAEIDGGGVGAMEMVSRDMKSLGMYTSGSISFGVDPASGKAVEYRERVHHLTPEQRRMYNHATAAWRAVLQNIDRAIEITNAGSRARGVALTKFWGDHQRFFRQLICAFKVPSVVAEAEAALAAGKSAVISLVGTGEAKTREQVARVIAEGGNLEDLDFSPREIIAAMIERGFPTQLYQDQTDPVGGKTIQVAVTDATGAPVDSQEALRMKQALIDRLSAVALPENPLDQLVNHFGEANVGELTGRTRRLIRDPGSGRVEYKKRAPEGVPMNRVNIHEMRKFQEGRCRVAIISDAGSIGISLHASNRAANHERRVHITLELGWSADKQMQCFGRTHRSGQAEPPEYVLLSTELGGEKRFSSTIARRLASLGALTKGDRGAADNADWARYNFETEEGKAALGLLYKRILAGESVPNLPDPRQALHDIGLLVSKDGTEQIRKEDERNVPRFLNRILALEVEEQNALFDHFADLFDQTVRYAKATGTFDEGVTDIKAMTVRLARPPAVIHADHVTGAETVLYTLNVALPTDKVPFERAERLRVLERGAFFQHQKNGKLILALPSGRHTDPADGRTFATYSVWKPEGARLSYIREMELNDKYRVLRSHEAEKWWTSQYARVPEIETREVRILAGAIIPLWQRLKTKGDRKLRVVRVSTEDGERIVGVEIPSAQVGAVLRALGLRGPTTGPAEIFHSLLEGGEAVRLVSALTLESSMLQGENVIELVCADPNRFRELRNLGLINEQIRFKQRFFVPTDEAKGVPIIAALLARYPVVPEESSEEPEQEGLSIEIPVTDVRMVELGQWVQPPEPDKEETSPENIVLQPEVEAPLQTSAEPIFSEITGLDTSALLEQRAHMTGRGRRKVKIVTGEQGLLFSGVQ